MVVVDPKITAKTERLFLRPLSPDDAQDVLLMRSDPEVMKHTSLQASTDLEHTKAWIRGCHTSPINWNFSIELLPPSSNATATSPTSNSTSTPAPRVIGLIGAVRAPEIGYMFNRQYWGKGYATEALRAFMPLFLEHYDGSNGEGKGERFEYAEAHTDPELVASHNVLGKVGFKLHEIRERDFENPILGWRDTWVFQLHRDGKEREGVQHSGP